MFFFVEKRGRKSCTTNRENRSIMRIVKQNQFKNLGELLKEWTEAGVKALRAPHIDVSRNLATVVYGGVSPGRRRRRTGLLPSGPKSSFQMRANFVFHFRWALFVTYTIIQSIMRSEICSLHLTHPSGAVGSRHCGARGTNLQSITIRIWKPRP